MRFTSRYVRPIIAALFFIAISSTAQLDAHAQVPAPANQNFTPQVGQEGKDVVWVPTPDDLVERMMQMADVKSSDFVVDLGSGDGRTVIAAAKRGAQALGIEYNADMVALAKRNAGKEGVAARAKFIKADIFETDFSQATVITMYLLPTLNFRLRPRILAMKPGTRVVSHAFTMGDWPPDRTERVDSRYAYLWIVPASVTGNWQVDSGEQQFQIVLRQTYQMVEGTATIDGKVTPIRATLRGDELSFSVPGSADDTQTEFVGRLDHDVIAGTWKTAGSPQEQRWSARRGGNQLRSRQWLLRNLASTEGRAAYSSEGSGFTRGGSVPSVPANWSRNPVPPQL